MIRLPRAVASTIKRCSFLPAAAVLLGLAAGGCDNHSPGSSIVNQPPEVWFTGGPPRLENEIAREPYNIRFYWSGADPDGTIEHFEYVIDPNPDPQNPVFTEHQIAHPELYVDSGELEFHFRPGIRNDIDTLTYSKPGPGNPVSFTYLPTRQYKRNFSMVADLPDSSGIEERKGLAFKNHRIYLRGIDNQGLYSEPDILEFTAVTVVPTAHIKFPNIQNVGDAGLTLGSSIRISWTGVDLDQSVDTKEPIGYYYKIVDFESLNIPNFTESQPDFIYNRVQAVKDLPWVYQSADTTETFYRLAVGHSYMFAVRAVDEAGAQQQTYSLGGYAQQSTGNVVKFSATPFTGSPRLTLSEPTLGDLSGSGSFIEEIEVPPGTELNFILNGDASNYGGIIGGFSYGVDIQNLELEDGPASQWSPWSLIPTMDPIVFYEENSNHILYVRARDTAGTVTLGTILIHVADFNFERQLLLVDDFQNTNWPVHQEHTDFWIDALTASGRLNGEDLKPEILIHRVWGSQDRDQIAVPPDIGYMGQYKMIFWTLNRGNGLETGMMKSGPQRRHLTAYVRGGGKLLVAGQSTMLSLMPGGGTPADVLDESKPNGGPSSFAYNTMRLYGVVDNGRLDDRDRLVRAEPFPGKQEIWPAVDIDKAKLSRGANRGVPYCESILEQLFTSVDPHWFPEIKDDSGNLLVRGEQLDSLYVYRAKAALEEGKYSKYDLGLNAIRYSDSRITRRKQHRTIWMGFPIYYLKDEHAVSTIRNIIDWFRDEPVLPHGT